MSVKPDGFVARCRCGVMVGAMDYTRMGKQEAGATIGEWLMHGCTVEPRFGQFQELIKPCRCGQASEVGPEFTDSARAALLWLLWHHQGGNSPVGQPIRFALGMGQHERLSDDQVKQAEQWGSLFQGYVANAGAIQLECCGGPSA